MAISAKAELLIPGSRDGALAAPNLRYCGCPPPAQTSGRNGRSKGRQFPISAAHMDVSTIDLFGGYDDE